MLYHASKISGLRELTPRPSTHGVEYVYAIKSRITAICFGAPKDDFDLLMDEVDGIPVLYECYPGAFQRIYAGKNGSLYEVSEEGLCVMNEYSENTVYQSMLQDELAERVKMYGLTEKQMNQDTRFCQLSECKSL